MLGLESYVEKCQNFQIWTLLEGFRAKNDEIRSLIWGYIVGEIEVVFWL